VVRAARTPEQIALYAGTGLAAAGDIIRVLDPYLNLDSRISKGWDFGLAYNVPDFGAGDFRLRFNAARLNGFVQSAGADGQTLLDAVASGALPPEVRIEGLGELLELDGRPKWRFSGSVNWGLGPVDVGVFAQYVGQVWNTSVSRDVPFTSADPNINFYRVDDMLTFNLSVSYSFEDGALDGTRIRLGVNNVFDTDPPLADETYGFFSALHSPRGRVFRVELRKTF
jgi:outer membrane receptor protein involved in Fe transport